MLDRGKQRSSQAGSSYFIIMSKKGQLGEGICCVVSVSMLTEGWDANTVTHIFGVRVFGSG